MVDNVRNDLVGVGITSKNIAELGDSALNPRTSIIIRNTSLNTGDVITLNVGRDVAVANKGVVLQKGDVYADSNSEGYISYQGRIQAICLTANGKLSIMER